MSDLFKLQREVSETTANINPDDVFNVKKYLKNLGYYQEPEWGMTKFTDNQMFDGIRKFQKDNHLKVDGVMKPEGETENAFNKLLRKGGYLSSSALQGVSLGWADEIKGAAGAVGYGLGSLNPKWNQNGERFSEAMKRGYRHYRDTERRNLEDGRREMPVSTRTMEAAGAFVSPNKLFKAAKGTPLRFMRRKNLLDMTGSSIVYGTGVSENKPGDYAKNIAAAGVGNVLGLVVGKFLYGRGNNRQIERAATSAFLNESVQKTFDMIFDKKRK